MIHYTSTLNVKARKLLEFGQDEQEMISVFQQYII